MPIESSNFLELIDISRIYPGLRLAFFFSVEEALFGIHIFGLADVTQCRSQGHCFYFLSRYADRAGSLSKELFSFTLAWAAVLVRPSGLPRSPWCESSSLSWDGTHQKVFSTESQWLRDGSMRAMQARPESAFDL
jgi:hypothetical protein